jgi:uncharacterized phage-like protein YoqJ
MPILGCDGNGGKILLKTCFFIGNHDAPESLKERLEQTVEQLITERGVDDFVVGRYGSFDRMAAGAVKAAKKRHPEVTLSMLLPYYGQDEPEERFLGFDHTFYPPGMERVPKRFAIVRANRYMLRHCDFLIAYDAHGGNTRKLLEEAGGLERRGQMHIIKITEKQKRSVL